MKMVTINELVSIMEMYDKQTFFHINIKTIPSMNKTSRITKEPLPYKNVRKFSSFTAMSLHSYKQIIENRLKKNDLPIESYVPGESWHEAVPGSSILRQHKETKEKFVYAFLVANNKPTSRFINEDTGAEIDRKELEPYLRPTYAPKNQGLDKEDIVNVRTMKLASVKSITIDKEEYIVA